MNAPTPPAGIAARYPDICPRCPEPIHQGDRVVYQRGRYIHVTCANGADDA